MVLLIFLVRDSLALSTLKLPFSFSFIYLFIYLLFSVAVSFNVLITLKRRRQGVDRLKAQQINWVGYPVRIWILQFNTLI